MTKGIITKLIDESFNHEAEVPRDYLGASMIGNPCLRSVWYSYNKIPTEPFTAKQKRTFAIGSLLESFILSSIEFSGCKVLRFCEALQDKEIPELKGHVDAYLADSSFNPIAVLEIKTARDSSFKIFVNKGIKQWSPVYYAQLQAYMGMAGINEAYIVVLNKDTSEIFDEQVLFDEIEYEVIKNKAKIILRADEAPEKINNSPLFYLCRMCRYKNICHS